MRSPIRENLRDFGWGGAGWPGCRQRSTAVRGWQDPWRGVAGVKVARLRAAFFPGSAVGTDRRQRRERRSAELGCCCAEQQPSPAGGPRTGIGCAPFFACQGRLGSLRYLLSAAGSRFIGVCRGGKRKSRAGKGAAGKGCRRVSPCAGGNAARRRTPEFRYRKTRRRWRAPGPPPCRRRRSRSCCSTRRRPSCRGRASWRLWAR